MSQWPPAYILRRSRRARNVSLQIDPVKGLELVLPHRMPVDEGLAFLESKRAWIEKHAALLKVEPNPYHLDLPSHIDLQALEKSWALRYHFLPNARALSVRHMDERLVFTGKIVDVHSCLPAIKKWLKKLAEIHFPIWLAKLAEETQLSYQRMIVRGQKTLWGSCSPQGSISLNYKLLFLPFDLVRYVFIHELCHTVHLNHSKRFWALVAKYDPHYRQHEKGLRNANQSIPSWLL